MRKITIYSIAEEKAGEGESRIKYLICPLGVLHLFLGPDEFSLTKKRRNFKGTVSLP